ncbi:MAG: hypothetical protein PVJ75_14390 [Chloroflexota bacterium]|jgi:hypothetical protein
MNDDQSQDELAFGENDHRRDEEDDEIRLVACDYCDVELELSDEELAQGWYICPECGEVSHLATPGGETFDAPQAEAAHRDARHQPQEVVECGHCKEIVTLSARQVKQGWFFCPHCHGLGQLDDFVTCLSCGSKLELAEEEWDQEWYRCPECDQVTHLVDSAEEEAEAPAPDFADQQSDADWVQLKTATGPEEAALEVAFLRANGVEAFTWQEGAGHAYGLTVGLLGASHIMVKEDQLELARSIIESQAEASPEADQPTDDTFSETSKAMMGLTAIALNPLGAGMAIGASQLLGRHHADEQANLVDCPQCGTPLELSDEEVAQGHFICPECGGLIQLSNYVICPICQTELVLDEAERKQGWYRCPECDQVTQL